jgi:hypothetical protein
MQAAAFGWSIAATAFGRRGRWRRLDTLRLVAGLARVAGDDRPLDFQSSTKPLGARVEIHLKDGRTLHRSVTIPRGFAGATLSETNGRSVRVLMREKFLAAAGHVVGNERAAQAADLIEGLESLSCAEVARLLDVACLGVAELMPGD